ncbi:hypothetical protein Naga_100352g1 [Nannochloropsis gaditana]|uniref:Uncharacterized protein n=1 Tax=Nannochloropsis gaditana TaxID=72520 RepID=W7TJ68_9STRA|nr:hypothetical protein Naga_100352g1 [Nannochloropsis gaditana]
MAFLADVQKEVCDGEVPALPLRWWGLFAGILNFFFFGWGTILAGVRSDRPTTIFIGVLQFILPVVGWIWSMVWGYLLISRAEQYSSLI